ncbi:hypothetical protein PAXRUDRAFT_173708 [Paxillus rubicundulus Ve08.2h10]|uniref:Uncharacterized protein n=1 Tax=Paxillus rubicundulus Ve08.2h10 TaxID=930991 RepID=A0A0D0BUM7_9AGAM|nr:hypothetical protein PAXRUDRAFT_173708 [Paxillus rubicundulus Ve08.2h10]
MPESRAAFIGEVPQSVLLGEAGERNNNVRIIIDETAVEVGEAKEGLDVLDFMRFWPIRNGFDFVGGHSQAYLTDMLFLEGHVLGVDEDVIQIDYNTNIEHISKDGIDELLESHQSVGQTERHYQPLIGAIVGVEGSLPFVSGHDVDKMVGMPEVNFGVDFAVARGVEEDRDEREWIVVFLRDFVESSEVDAKAE